MNDDDHRTFRLDCDCHEPLHFIKFEWMRWPESANIPDHETLDAFICSHRVGGFWKRIGRALRYVFGSQDLVTGDIVLSKEKARELAVFLKGVAT